MKAVRLPMNSMSSMHWLLLSSRRFVISILMTHEVRRMSMISGGAKLETSFKWNHVAEYNHWLHKFLWCVISASSSKTEKNLQLDYTVMYENSFKIFWFNSETFWNWAFLELEGWTFCWHSNWLYLSVLAIVLVQSQLPNR